MPGAPDVFFHVGLGKAASTFLQYRFFPKLKGIRYIQRTQYKQAPEKIRALLGGGQAGSQPILLSREFDQQLERECTRFRKALPEAAVQPIVVLRRQDGWLASQYRRHLKNGSPLSFPEFIDVEQDKGLWHLHDAEFLPKLQFLEACFGCKPLIFFHEDLKRDPQGFLAHMAEQLGAGIPDEGINAGQLHASYSEHQLLWMRRLSRRWFPEPIAHGQTSWLQRRGRLLACYAVLYGSRLLPAPSGAGSLIEKGNLERIRAHFAEDWAACKDYAGADARPI